MDGRIVPADLRMHRSVQEMLPWFATDTLDAEEAARVREHLRHCARCRNDLDRQRRLRAISLPAAPELDVDRALAKLQPRLDAVHRRPALLDWMQRLHGLLPGRWSAAVPAQMQLLLASQATLAVLAGLAVAFLAWPVHDQPAYHALSDTQGATGRIVVMFKPDTTEQQLRSSLRAHGARLMDGPTETGAYVLGVAKAERERALQVLRADPAVTLAEPLDVREQR